VAVFYDYGDPSFTPVFSYMGFTGMTNNDFQSHGENLSEVPNETQQYIQNCFKTATNTFRMTKKGKSCIKKAEKYEPEIPF
jgi:hypothetical protein